MHFGGKMGNELTNTVVNVISGIGAEDYESIEVRLKLLNIEVIQERAVKIHIQFIF